MSSQNAYRGGMRPRLKELSRLLKKQQEQLTTIDLD
jgi:hypothetical protein